MATRNRRRRIVIVPIGPSIAYIPLTQGQFALVDSADAAMVGQWNWYARWANSCRSFYASRLDTAGGTRKTFLNLHRVLLNPSAGMLVDHKNSNSLDNRRCNLREATYQQNCQNQRRRIDSKSGFRGVHWDALREKFISKVRHNGKTITLWRGQDPSVGHAIYCEAITRLHGEFARFD